MEMSEERENSVPIKEFFAKLEAKAPIPTFIDPSTIQINLDVYHQIIKILGLSNLEVVVNDKNQETSVKPLKVAAKGETFFEGLININTNNLEQQILESDENIRDPYLWAEKLDQEFKEIFTEIAKKSLIKPSFVDSIIHFCFVLMILYKSHPNDLPSEILNQMILFILGMNMAINSLNLLLEMVVRMKNKDKKLWFRLQGFNPLGIEMDRYAILKLYMSTHNLVEQVLEKKTHEDK